MRLASYCVNSNDAGLMDWLAQFEGRDEICQRAPVLVMGDDFGELICERDTVAGQPVALCLSGGYNGSFLAAYQAGVRYIIYRNEPFDREAFTLVRQFYGDNGSELTDFCEFLPPPQVLASATWPVALPADIQAVEERAQDFARQQGYGEERQQGVCLCVTEGVTNAIYHGFREAGSHDRKYHPELFHGLFDGDSVDVQMWATPEWLALRISDNSGSMGPMRLPNALDRHRTEKGLMDSRGRGLYLMQHLADRMVVQVHRGRKTAVDLYFTKAETTSPLRHFELLVR